MAWSKRFIPKLFIWHSSRDIVRMKWRYYQYTEKKRSHWSYLITNCHKLIWLQTVRYRRVCSFPQPVVLSTTHQYQAWESICWFWSTVCSTRPSQTSVQRAACRPKGQVKRLGSRLLWKPHRLGWLLNDKRMFSGYQVSLD